MTKLQAHVRHLLEQSGGVLSYRCAPELTGSIRRMARNGELTAILPGVFAATVRMTDPLVRMRAIALRDPDAVFTGESAAALLWNRPGPEVITATGRLRTKRPWASLSERVIDPEWITDRLGVRCTVPELTAIDLIPALGPDFVDQLLRESRDGKRTLARMWEAYRSHPKRPGNQLREHILRESRDQPWSAAERLAHRHLREAGMRGWVTNHRVVLGSRVYYLDIAVPKVQLALEVDGFASHRTKDAFDNDRIRQNDLVVADWTVLRITWTMLQNTDWLRWLAPWHSALLAPSSGTR